MVPYTVVKSVAKKISWNEAETDPNYLPRFPLKRDRFRACLNQGELLYNSISNQGSPYGNYVRASHFHYVRVFDAGHMINGYKPENAAHLFNQWVFERDKFAQCNV